MLLRAFDLDFSSRYTSNLVPSLGVVSNYTCRRYSQRLNRESHHQLIGSVSWQSDEERSVTLSLERRVVKPTIHPAVTREPEKMRGGLNRCEEYGSDEGEKWGDRNGCRSSRVQSRGAAKGTLNFVRKWAPGPPSLSSFFPVSEGERERDGNFSRSGRLRCLFVSPLRHGLRIHTLMWHLLACEERGDRSGIEGGEGRKEGRSRTAYDQRVIHHLVTAKMLMPRSYADITGRRSGRHDRSRGFLEKWRKRVKKEETLRYIKYAYGTRKKYNL